MLAMEATFGLFHNREDREEGAKARVEVRRIKVSSAELIRSHGGSKLSVIEFFI